MLIGEIISVALGALRANKLRSLLTMLGIVIGVAAVIAMVALGSGAQQAVKDRIAPLGTTLLSVSPGQARGFGAAIGGQRQAHDHRGRQGPRRSGQPPRRDRRGAGMQKSAQVTWTNQNTNTSIIGTTANYLTVRNYKLALGRMFTEAEDAGQRRVAVVGPTVATNLGLTTPDALVGEDIRIGGMLFTVIGVTEPKGRAAPSATRTIRS